MVQGEPARRYLSFWRSYLKFWQWVHRSICLGKMLCWTIAIHQADEAEQTR
jgi:hypothetical protein